MIFKLFEFKGGLHLDDHKAISTQMPIQDLRQHYPSELILPLTQHAGHSALPIIEIGDKVLAGQCIATADDRYSSSIHAPTSGIIIDIRLHSIPHPSGLNDYCMILQPDGLHQYHEDCFQSIDFKSKSSEELLNLIQSMGIVGLGGAVFPTHLKLTKPIETLIINGAECEPYITCDDMLMREHASTIIRGIEILSHVLSNPKQIMIAIEDNKPQAIRAIQQAVKQSSIYIDVAIIPTKYPAGSAKQLIKYLTNIEIPYGQRSTDFGIQCFNVATSFSIAQAIDKSLPMMSRIVTITGELNQPQNIHVLLGTPIQHIFDLLNYKISDKQECVMGGPMMGISLQHTHLPIVKASNCILVQQRKIQHEMPCIRCGECATVCPSELQPMDLYWFAKSKNFKKAESYHLADCIECGCCNVVCPSDIPLVDYYRFAKSELKAESQKLKFTTEARERHEFRQFRLERDQQERSQRLAEKAKQKVDSADSDAKKAQIAEALARVKAKKLAQNNDTNENSS